LGKETDKRKKKRKTIQQASKFSYINHRVRYENKDTSLNARPSLGIADKRVLSKQEKGKNPRTKIRFMNQH